jgi:ParB-like chromosome segregation protein Spo0J
MKKYQIKIRLIEELQAYEKNSRTHTEEQISQVSRSIEEFGFTNPVLIRGNTIIAGHCRVLAAQKLGWSEVPTIALDGLTDSQAKAYVIADNKLALNAGWNNDLLKLEIDELKADDFDIGLLGFTLEELKGLGNFDDDFSPDLPDENDSENEEKPLVLRIVFETEDEQQMLFTELRDRGYKVKV